MLHLKVHLRFRSRGHLKLHKKLMVHLSVQLRVHPGGTLKLHVRTPLAIYIKKHQKVHLRLHF